VANTDNLKPFKKDDPRINRKGRPKSFDQARALAQQIAAEVMQGEGGKPLTTADGKHLITRIEAIFRAMSSSRNPRDRELFLAYAVGKPKEETEHSGKVELVIKYADDDSTTETA
jgi:hypothetical protein